MITPNGKTVYTTNTSGTVTPISTANNKAGKAIRAENFPAAIAITPSLPSGPSGGLQP